MRFAHPLSHILRRVWGPAMGFHGVVPVQGSAIGLHTSPWQYEGCDTPDLVFQEALARLRDESENHRSLF
jgi:hypothetical protein